MIPLAPLVAVALSVWGAPACGTPAYAINDLRSITAAGVAYRDSCSFQIDARVITAARSPLGYDYLCNTVVHEVGHLRLGPMFTANTDDPWHDPHPGAIMSEAGGRTRACAAETRRHFRLTRSRLSL